MLNYAGEATIKALRVIFILNGYSLSILTGNSGGADSQYRQVLSLELVLFEMV